MKKIILCIILLFIIIPASYAKRSAPPKVDSLIYKGIRYSAPSDLMGCIRADDIKTNSMLWFKQIYIVKYLPKLERDVQCIFINKIEIKDDSLIISNEAGYSYKLNLKSLMVEVLQGKEIIQWSE